MVKRPDGNFPVLVGQFEFWLGIDWLKGSAGGAYLGKLEPRIVLRH